MISTIYSQLASPIFRALAGRGYAVRWVILECDLSDASSVVTSPFPEGALEWVRLGSRVSFRTAAFVGLGMALPGAVLVIDWAQWAGQLPQSEIDDHDWMEWYAARRRPYMQYFSPTLVSIFKRNCGRNVWVDELFGRSGFRPVVVGGDRPLSTRWFRRLQFVIANRKWGVLTGIVGSFFLLVVLVKRAYFPWLAGGFLLGVGGGWYGINARNYLPMVAAFRAIQPIDVVAAPKIKRRRRRRRARASEYPS